jgi:hypothetical protein
MPISGDFCDGGLRRFAASIMKRDRSPVPRERRHRLWRGRAFVEGPESGR